MPEQAGRKRGERARSLLSDAKETTGNLGGLLNAVKQASRELVSLGVVANAVSHGSEDERSESSGG